MSQLDQLLLALNVESRMRECGSEGAGRGWQAGRRVRAWSLVLCLLGSSVARGQACITCRTERCAVKEGLTEWCGEGRDPLARRNRKVRPARPKQAPPHDLDGVSTTPAAPPTLATPATPECPPGMSFIDGGTLVAEGGQSIAIAPLCLDETEVTIVAWEQCRQSGGCVAAPLEPGCNAFNEERQLHPVNCVTREQASTYCAFRGARLPLDWEWAWAARGGGEGRKFPWGNDAPRTELCWDGAGDGFGLGERTGTCEVVSFPSSDGVSGIHDLAGNVAEWTVGKDASEWIIRGGSFGSVRAATVSATRTVVLRDAGSYRSKYVGFRCAAAPIPTPVGSVP